MELTKELYQFIDSECKKFKKDTWEDNDVDVNDVIYSYLFSTPDTFHIKSDWSEGKNNDPFWNDELDEHSAIVFLKDMCKKIDTFYVEQ